MLDRIDDFLSTHELRVQMPEELGSTVGEIKMPLTDGQVVQQGRSKIRIFVLAETRLHSSWRFFLRISRFFLWISRFFYVHPDPHLSVFNSVIPFFLFFFSGRGFVRKIVIPFLLGLKFKATVLVPVAIAVIALKTWKALTLGLLSLVLSAAMVIYRFTKPKVVGVEILHYPSPVHAHHHDGYAHARAYSAQQPAEQS